MSVPTLRLRRFNPRIIEEKRLAGSPPTIVVIGKRGTGKSTLIKDLLYEIQNIPMVIGMSGTEEGNGFYGKYIHPLCVHNDYKPEITSNIIKQQKIKVKRLQKDGIDPRTRPDIGVGLLLDDCGYDKKIFKEKDIREIFMNGRHFQICLMLSLQYMMGMPPDLRTNIDYVFCLRDNITANQKRLYDYFFGCFKKFAHFQEAFAECTDNYSCLVLDNTAKSTKIEDCVFHYKANPDRVFKIGSRELWAMLNQRLKDEEENEDDDDYNKQTKQTQKLVVIKKKI